jgi:hypothetical protein
MAKGAKTGGRQKGTPNKATADVKEAAQAYTVEAVEALVAIMRDSESDAAKVAAVKELLDRAHGKPKQSVDVGGKLDVTKITRTIVDPKSDP